MLLLYHYFIYALPSELSVFVIYIQRLIYLVHKYLQLLWPLYIVYTIATYFFIII